MRSIAELVTLLVNEFFFIGGSAEMATWKVGAKKNLPILDTDREWDGDAARSSLFGDGDEIDQAAARGGHLVWNPDDPSLKQSYKLPFAMRIDGEIVTFASALRAAASRLSQTDIPESVQTEARKVLDAYFERMEAAKETRMNPLKRQLEMALRTLLGIVTNPKVSRDIGVSSIGGQVITLLDAYNMENAGENWTNYHFLQDLYMDEEGGMYCISVSDGVLYKWSVSVDLATNAVGLGEPTMVKPFFSENGSESGGSEKEEPVQQTIKPFRVRKRTDGRYEALAILSTCQLNKSGEIDSRKLFDCFVNRFKGDGSEYINIYHIGRAATRIGELKTIFREENLLIGHYVLDDSPVANAVGRTLAADEEGKWGGSIEFWSDDEGVMVEIAEDIYVRAFDTGTLFGYSIAPSAHGAAWGTMNMQLERTMTPAGKLVVDELLGGDEEAKKAFEQMVDTRNARINEPGVVTRTTEPPAPVAEARTEEQREVTGSDAEDYGDEDEVVSVDADGASLEIGSEEWDTLVQAVTDAVIASEWGRQLVSDHETFSSRLASVESSIETLQAAIGEEQTSAEDVADDETAEHMQTRIASLEADVARLRSFYDANSSPSHRTLVVRRGVASGKDRKLQEEAAAAAVAEEVEPQEPQPVHMGVRTFAQTGKLPKFKSKGLFQKAK